MSMGFSIKKIFIVFLLSIFFLLSAATVAVSYFNNYDDTDRILLLHTLRINALETLLDQGFDRFATFPFGPGYDFIHLTGSQTTQTYPDYYLTTGITLDDDLDQLILQKIDQAYADRVRYQKFSQPSFDDIVRTQEDIQSLQTVYLFKSEKDLKDLGYVVTSFRTRINEDPNWRQANIFNSYRNIGNVRVLNPGQELKFMDEIHYEPNAGDHKRDLASGMANV
jgi:hypothetical protein